MLMRASLLSFYSVTFLLSISLPFEVASYTGPIGVEAHFFGNVVESGCDAVNTFVDFKDVSKKELQPGRKTAKTEFDIVLINCSVDTLINLSIEFSTVNPSVELSNHIALDTSSTGGGIAIGLLDMAENEINLNQKYDFPNAITSGCISNKYIAYVEAIPGQPVTEGIFFSNATFNIIYM